MNMMIATILCFGLCNSDSLLVGADKFGRTCLYSMTKCKELEAGNCFHTAQNYHLLDMWGLHEFYLLSRISTRHWQAGECISSCL